MTASHKVRTTRVHNNGRSYVDEKSYINESAYLVRMIKNLISLKKDEQAIRCMMMNFHPQQEEHMWLSNAHASISITIERLAEECEQSSKALQT